MNKYFMLGAAALLTTSAAGAADGASYSVHFATASGASYCNGVEGSEQSGIYVAQLVYSTCGSNYANIESLGLVSKGKPPGDTREAKGNSKGQVGLLDYSQVSQGGGVFLEDLETPIRAGGSWALWVCFASDSCYLGSTGILAAGQYAKVPGKAAKSTVAAAIEAFQAHAQRSEK
ncbi:MAG: hypothetical protein ABSD74_20605 [Rhizomicrobium sp.]|jgi:hypothetical protein